MYFVDYDTCEFRATSHDLVNIFAFRPFLEMAGKCALMRWLGLLNSSPLDKTAAISQMTFSNAFSSMKCFVFCFEFHWNFFLRVQLTMIALIGSGIDLAANMRQAITESNAVTVHWRIYGALGRDELTNTFYHCWMSNSILGPAYRYDVPWWPSVNIDGPGPLGTKLCGRTMATEGPGPCTSPRSHFPAGLGWTPNTYCGKY